MQIKLAQAIEHLRNELRDAVTEGKNKDILFTPTSIELELAVTFGLEAEGGGGFKLLTFLDLSAKGKVSDSSQHKVKLVLAATDREGKPLQVSYSGEKPSLPGGTGPALPR